MHDTALMALLVDLVIAVTAVECVVLVLHHRRTGAGVAPRHFALNMAAGFCLMLALRGVVHDSGAAWVAAFLLLAGAAHSADILRLWRRGAHPGGGKERVVA